MTTHPYTDRSPSLRLGSARKSQPKRNRRLRRCRLERLEKRQLLAGDVLFADSFESGSHSNDWVGNWVEDSQDDWNQTSQRALDGTYAAEVDDSASDAALSLANPIDLTSYTDVELTFSWYIESRFDSGEYLRLEISNGGGWTQVAQIDGTNGWWAGPNENVWRTETISVDPSFLTTDFSVRFLANVSSSSEDGFVDDVKITGTPAAPQFPPTIAYTDFSNPTDLNLVGHATTTVDNRLRLSDTGLRQGSAWHAEQQTVSTAFETEFDFVLAQDAQGLGFVIQNTRAEMLGGSTGFQGVPNSLAVEFDTKMQSNQNDPNDNHVSIQSRAREHNSAHHDFSLGTSTSLPDMNDGQSHTAKIRYASGLLSVFVDDLVSPVLSASVDINELLDLDYGQAWVGFTSGSNRHEILSWQFRPQVDLSTTIGIHDAEILEGDNGTQQLVFQVQRIGTAASEIQWNTADDSAIVEATQDGNIEGLPFVAGVGGDSVRGVGNGTYEYSYDAMPNAKTAVLSSAGMDGGDGGWAVLRGNNPVPATSGTISLSIDEDQLRDSERNHTTEQVAYFVIDPPVGESSQSNETIPFETPLAGSPSGVKADSIQRDGLTAAEIPESSTKLVSSAPSPEVVKRQTRIELIDAALSESDNDWSASEVTDLLFSSLISRASFGSR